MSKKDDKLNEVSQSGHSAGSDGNFSPKGVKKDDYIMSMQNQAPTKTAKDFEKMVNTEIPKEFKGFPVFDISDEGEFMSFQKGIKRFHLWKQHTTSETVRQFARTNPNKDFYIHNAGRFLKINRSKK